MTEVRLYTRPGCHLCDEAREAILELRASGLGFDLREVNIEQDERLHAEYLERIPVVEVGGEIVSELVLDVHALRSRLHTVAA
ncbi:MAG TPA: glutaredoxin family protein [Solirubrobacterales bacterium]|nr:glutaredoxin family protein [Solirubrobacterales bacterium]